MSWNKIDIPTPSTSDSETEKRKELRTPLRVLRVQTEIRGDVFFGYARNLSATGMFIQTPNPKEVGQEVELRFALTPRSKEIRCRAKIVWARNYLGKTREEPGMGLIFIDLSIDDAEAIRSFISSSASLP